MRLAVSGATGFIGAAVVRLALARGHEVAAVIRPESDPGRLPPGTQAVFGRLEQPQSYAQPLAAFAPDAAIHCAWAGIDAASRDDLALQGGNFALTMGFLAACRQAGVGNWIGIGSQAEYGPAECRLDEGAPTRPTTAYGCVKLAAGDTAGRLCEAWGVRFAWLRVFQTYGPGDNPAFLVPGLIRRLLDGQRPALGDGTPVWDLLHVDDAAAAILHAAAGAGLSGPCNLGSGQPRTIRSIAESVRDAIDPSLPLGFGELPPRPGGPTHLEADIGKLERAGWRPTITWADGLRQTIAWHRAQKETS